MKNVWEGDVPGIGRARVRSHVGSIECSIWCGGAYEWEEASGSEQVLIKSEALRRLLERQAHADTVAKAASHVLAKEFADSPVGEGDRVRALDAALRRLIRAVVDGPEPKEDVAAQEFKAQRPPLDVARDIIAAKGWPSRARADTWLMEVIASLRGVDAAGSSNWNNSPQLGCTTPVLVAIEPGARLYREALMRASGVR